MTCDEIARWFEERTPLLANFPQTVLRCELAGRHSLPSGQIHLISRSLETKVFIVWTPSYLSSNVTMALSCPDPFISESLFPSTGRCEYIALDQTKMSHTHSKCLLRFYSDTAAAVSSRWCEDIGGVSCCLPCPISYWRWKDVNCTLKTRRSLFIDRLTLSRACGWCTTCSMAEYTCFNRTGVATGHLCYIPCEPDGLPLFKYRPSDWADVHIGMHYPLIQWCAMGPWKLTISTRLHSLYRREPIPKSAIMKLPRMTWDMMGYLLSRDSYYLGEHGWW